MKRIFIYGTGSSGNCLLVENESTNFVLDIGVNLFNSKKMMGVDFSAKNNIDYLFISHEHVDHTKYLKVAIERNLKTKIFINKECFKALLKKFKMSFLKAHKDRFIFLNAKNNYYADHKIKVVALEVNHNSAKNNAYLIYLNKEHKKFLYITDCGSFDYKKYNKELFNDLDYLFLESNYDSDIVDNLETNDVKILTQRSNYGHFSNKQALEFLKYYEITKETNVYFIHTSATQFKNADLKDKEMYKDYKFMRIKNEVHIINNLIKILWKP